MAAATAQVEWGKTKINLLDTPGFSMFIHEAEMALPAVEAALVVVDAVSRRGSHHRAHLATTATNSPCRAPSSAPAWTASAPTSIASWNR